MRRRDFRAAAGSRGVAGKLKNRTERAGGEPIPIPNLAACGSCAAASSAMDSGACAMR
jgi:hypothetical protein